MQERLELGLKIGATCIINSLNESPEDVIFKKTGLGVDVSFEAAGVQVTLNSAVNVIKKWGTCCIINFGKVPELNLGQLMLNEIRLTTTFVIATISQK